MAKKFLGVMLALLLGAVGSVRTCRSDATIEVRANPNVVEIGAFFNGKRISVQGEAPPGCDVQVRVQGVKQELTLKKKGRVFGVLWMNLDSLTFHGVPKLYQIYTSKGLDVLRENEPEMGKKLGLGFFSLERQMEMSPPQKDARFWVKELFKLKASQGLYTIWRDAVRYGETKNGVRAFETVVTIPSSVAPGNYEIKVFAIRKGAIAATGEAKLGVVKVGLPRRLSSLAFSHGGIYGFLAALVAVLAGLIMGYLFKGEGRSH